MLYFLSLIYHYYLTDKTDCFYFFSFYHIFFLKQRVEFVLTRISDCNFFSFSTYRIHLYILISYTHYLLENFVQKR